MTRTGRTTEMLAAAATAPVAVVSTSSSDIATFPALPIGEEIYDLLPPKALAHPWFSLIMQTLLVVLAFYLLWLFYCWLTRPAIRVRQPIQQSPQKQAFRAIERLKLSPVWEKRQFKEICETLAQILKNYTKDQFNLGIGEASTTDELLNVLQQQSILSVVYDQIKDLLLACDQIKYAGLERHEKTPEELMSVLLNLVKETRWLK